MEPLQKSLVVLNGSKPSRSLIHQFWNEVDCRICADGAANSFIEYGLAPDVIIGDLDSVPSDFEEHFPDSKVLKDPSQNTTDGEKALDYCVQHNYLDITIIGALGNRLDHTLYSISLLKNFSHKTQCITIYSDDEKIFVIDKSYVLKELKGARISLMPVFGKVTEVKTEGLKYPLAGETLAFGRFSSISNIIDQEVASISLGSGDLLVIIQR